MGLASFLVGPGLRHLRSVKGVLRRASLPMRWIDRQWSSKNVRQGARAIQTGRLADWTGVTGQRVPCLKYGPTLLTVLSLSSEGKYNRVTYASETT